MPAVKSRSLALPNPKLSMLLRQITLSAVLFVVAFAVYFESRFITQMDSRWSLYVTMSLLRSGDQTLDEFEEVTNDPLKYDVTAWYDGHTYSNYPIGGPLIAIPAVLFAEAVIVPLARGSYSVRKYIERRINRWQGDSPTVETMRPLLEMATASALCSLTAVSVYWLARRRARTWVAMLTTLAFAFGTSCWSTASRGLWQHTPSMLMLSLSLHCLLAFKPQAPSPKPQAESAGLLSPGYRLPSAMCVGRRMP